MFGSSSSLNSLNTSFGGAITSNNTDSTDITINPAGDDTIQCLKFSPTTIPNIFLASGSWDNNIRLWEVTQNGQVQQKAQKTVQSPVMDLAWSDDGMKLFSGEADNTAKCWDLKTEQQAVCAQHEAPIKNIHWIQSANYSCLVTASFDKTIKFWDMRQSTPAFNVQLEEKVYSCAVDYPMMVVCLANKTCIIYDLTDGVKEFRKITDQPLKYQLRCCQIFRNANTNKPQGFAMGTIEGRVAIQHADPAEQSKNFIFKCHRSDPSASNQVDVYPVNGISFHPQYMTLATVGGDGKYSFWDKDVRSKLKGSQQYDQQLSTCTIDPRGQIFAFGVGYDWSKGHENFDPRKQSKIILHKCDVDMKNSKK